MRTAREVKRDIDEVLTALAKAICPYCRAGMPLCGEEHVRGFGEFMEFGTDDRFPCKVPGLLQ